MNSLWAPEDVPFKGSKIDLSKVTAKELAAAASPIDHKEAKLYAEMNPQSNLARCYIDAMRELSNLVDRLGHDGGAVCGWGAKVPSAKEWAEAVWEAARDNDEFERSKREQLEKENAALKAQIKRPENAANLEERAKAFMAEADRKHAEWLAKPLTRAGWLDLLMRCQNGEASCMYVLKKIEADLEAAAK